MEALERWRNAAIPSRVSVGETVEASWCGILISDKK
jgi:hypothetical protein